MLPPRHFGEVVPPSHPADAPFLFVVAAPAEAAAVARAFGHAAPPPESAWRVRRLDADFRMVQSGIGKSNAAACVARAMERAGYRAVINVGIAGALPGSGLRLCQPVVAVSSVYADEGVETPSGFLTCGAIGFPLGPFEGNGVAASAWVRAKAEAALSPMGMRAGVIATVSTCSGTDAQAARVEQRTGALAEAMEGASVGHIVARFSDAFPQRAASFLEVRVISNTTGAREAQRWDIKGALAALTEVIRALGTTLT
jgi:futalosine hydrolase